MIKGRIKRMMKRKISLVLVVAMLLTLMMPTFAFGAADYSGHWAEDTIQEWFDNDKLKGYEDGSFRPDVQITRAEFMTMVNNAFEYTEKADINFADVDSGDWFYPEVQKAVKAGYLLGYEDNTARPGNKISRQEAALIIARIKDLSNSATGANKFYDVNDIASWAKGGVGAVADAKFMIGYEDNTFRPLRYISRAETLVTIDRVYEEEAPVEIPPTTGGGGGGSSNDDDGNVTTPSAILGGLSIQGIDVITPSAIDVANVTSYSAITSSSAVTVSAIIVDGTEVVITAFDASNNEIAITTSSAVVGQLDANITLANDVTTIKIRVTGTGFLPKEYFITVTKQIP
jgi:uncharacterized protein (UPF0212 family)